MKGELRHEIWISYPLPALIYDAKQGVTLSRLLVFHYYVTRIERKKEVRPDVQKFIAEIFRETLKSFVEDGDSGAPTRMFNPTGKKISTASPDHLDIYEALKGNSEDRYAAMKDIGIKNAKKGHKTQKTREERIWRVQCLLDEKARHEQNLDGEAARNCMTQLIDIYRDVANLV